MKRSEVNHLVKCAQSCFAAHGWALPKNAKWDVTDYGLNDWKTFGLVLINLAMEPEYWEKLEYQQRGMTCAAHMHKNKKEDIICRWGKLALQVWPQKPGTDSMQPCQLKVNGEMREVQPGEVLHLEAGERATMTPGTWHEFKPETDEAIIGEVSTWNDDENDNVFANEKIGRYSKIEEDEPPVVKLVSDK